MCHVNILFFFGWRFSLFALFCSRQVNNPKQKMKFCKELIESTTCNMQTLCLLWLYAALMFVFIHLITTFLLCICERTNIYNIRSKIIQITIWSMEIHIKYFCFYCCFLLLCILNFNQFVIVVCRAAETKEKNGGRLFVRFLTDSGRSFANS